MKFNINQLKKIVKKKRKDKFLSHFITVITWNYDFNADISKNKIVLWKQNKWSSSFYTVFTFEFDNKKQLSDIKTKLNPFGKVLIYIIISPLLYSFFLIDYSSFNLKMIWIPLIFGLLFFLIAKLAQTIYFSEQHIQLNEIFETIKSKNKIKVKCLKCNPKEDIEIPNFNHNEKVLLLNLKKESPIKAVKEIMNKLKITQLEAKFIITHINIKHGNCNKCNNNTLMGEYTTCSVCNSLNFNWNID